MVVKNAGKLVGSFSSSIRLVSTDGRMMTMMKMFDGLKENELLKSVKSMQ